MLVACCFFNYSTVPSKTTLSPVPHISRGTLKVQLISLLLVQFSRMLPGNLGNFTAKELLFGKENSTEQYNQTFSYKLKTLNEATFFC